MDILHRCLGLVDYVLGWLGWFQQSRQTRCSAEMSVLLSNRCWMAAYVSTWLVLHFLAALSIGKTAQYFAACIIYKWQDIGAL